MNLRKDERKIASYRGDNCEEIFKRVQNINYYLVNI